MENFTGFPEILEGRVKTLHPKIYGGILYDPANPAHQSDYQTFTNSNHQPFNLEKIDLIVCNLYPFASVAANPDKSEMEVIENIDIGGVCLLRAAVKLSPCSILCQPDHYQRFMKVSTLYHVGIIPERIACRNRSMWLYTTSKLFHLTKNTYQILFPRKVKYGCNLSRQAYLSTVDDRPWILNGVLDILTF